MKNIIGIFVAILVLSGLIYIARPTGAGDPQKTNKETSNPSSTLTAAETNYDFGTISMAAGKVSHEFKIKNTGSSPITIEKMYTSCMCTTALLSMGSKMFGPFGMPGHMAIPRINGVLNQSEEAIAEVIFDPAAHGPAGVGRIERSVMIENSAGNPVELNFSAVVTP